MDTIVGLDDKTVLGILVSGQSRLVIDLIKDTKEENLPEIMSDLADIQRQINEQMDKMTNKMHDYYHEEE